eukprot:TRINITY_DN2836_c0_g1_i1.p1 TRINITY_DN2836_c0_g1~~TRINITY_DN2836_c0_g1_i1.p1  ORF type:complete len:258 (+),score=40.44 TRINITY_DN2836_c0_g1_i1:193-966(+)
MGDIKNLSMHSLTGSKQLESWDLGSEFEIVKILGTGSYGSVCEAIHKPTKTKVAIKKVIDLFDDNVDCKRVLREVHLLRKLSHQNVVKLYEILEPKDTRKFNCIYLVMEYAQSDIKKLVKSAIHLQFIHIQKLIYNLLVGLKYVHSANVLHRDIKPANILINEDCTVRICDFGLARSIVGVEGTSLASMKKKTTASTEEFKTASDDEDVRIKNAKLAKINKDEAPHTTEAPKEGPKEETKKKEIKEQFIKQESCVDL